MNIKPVVFAVLLAGSGAALAQSQLPTVEVRGYNYEDTGAALSFACDNTPELSAADVESVLQINDRTQTPQLTLKLMGAVQEACAAGIPHIVVERGKDGKSVTWHSVD